MLGFTGFTYNRLTKKDPWTILRRFFFGAVPLLLLALLGHALSLGNGRIWLDARLLGADSFINSPDGILYSWFSTVEGDYAPLSWFIMWMEHFLWGAAGTGYHLLNIAFHVLNTIFVWRLCRHLNLKFSTPWFAAALFAVHPLGFPAVGWIYARSIILATTFSLASLLAFANYDKPNSDDLPFGYLLWSCFFAVMASLCHAGLALGLPFVALGMMGFRRGTKVATGARHVFRCLPLFICVLPGYLLSLILANAHQAQSLPYEDSWLGQFLHTAFLIFRLGLNLIWPGVSFLAPPFSPATPFLALVPVIVLAAALLLLFLLRRLPVARPLFFLLWTGAFILFGTIAFLPAGAGFRQGVVGTYLAYPMAVLLAIVLMGLVARLFSLLGEYAGAVGTNLSGVFITVLFLLALLMQASVLSEKERLWQQVIQTYPDIPLGFEYYARELAAQDRLVEALPQLRQAVALDPNNAEMRKMLGQALLIVGEPKEAEKHLRKAFELDPALAEGNIEAELQKQLEAIGNNPEGLPEFLNLSALPGHGKSDILDFDEVAFTTNETVYGTTIRRAYEAVKANDMSAGANLVARLIAEDPRGALGNYLAGYIAYENERLNKAVEHLKLALTTEPDLAGAYFFLGAAQAKMANYRQAREAFLKALKLQPKMAEGYYELGVISEIAGDYSAALEFYSATILIKQNHVDALRACADILATHPAAQLRNGEQALKLAQKAVLYAPESNARLLLTLGAAYAEAGFMRDAQASAKRALRKAQTDNEQQAARQRLAAFAQGQPFRRALLHNAPVRE